MNHRQSPILTAFAAGVLLFTNSLRAEKNEDKEGNPGAPKIGQAFDFKTDNGREMKHAILRRIEPDGLTFETKSSLEKMPISSLPPEIAMHFKYDPEEVARYVEKQRAAQKALAAKQAAEAAEAAKRADQKKAAATPPPKAAPVEAPLGARGEKSLGSPRLGGRGTEK